MAPQTSAAHLQTVLDAESVGYEPGALKLIARAARGSMRDALSLADQAIAFGAGAVEDEPVRRMLGAVDRGHAARIVEAVASDDARAIVAAVDGLRDIGSPAAGTVEETIALLQDMALHQAMPDATVDDADPDAAIAVRLAPMLAPDETQVLYSILVVGRTELALAGDEYGGLTMLLLRMLAFRPAGGAPRRAPAPTPQRSQAAPTPAVVTTAPEPTPDAAASTPPQKPLPAAPASTATPAATPTPTSPALSDRWATTVERMVAQARIGAMVRELAVQAQCVGWQQATGDGGELAITLRVERENLRAQPLRDRLQTALADAFARPVRLVVEAGTATDTPAERQAAARRQRQSEAERTIEDDPLVKALLAQYSSAAHRPRVGEAGLMRHPTPTFPGDRPMMKGQLAGLMKQAQAMQDNLKKAQDELATIEVEGQSGAGLVKVTMTCKHDVRRVTIDPSLVGDDKEMLEDLVAAAFNDGVRARKR